MKGLMSKGFIAVLLFAAALWVNGGIAMSYGLGNLQAEGSSFDPGSSVSSNEPVVVTKGDLRLEVRSDTGNIAVVDSRTGFEWQSNKLTPEEDIISFGINKQRVASQLIISYLDTTVMLETKSFMESVEKGSGRIEVFLNRDDVVTVCYTFQELGITIPVSYSLNSNGLTVQVPFAGIREEGTARLVTLSLLPFFGAGTMKEDGFILLPDGSGAIVEFNNGKTSPGSLTLKALYGDRSKPPDHRPAEEQPVMLPCFGISHALDKGAASMLAYVTEGEWGGTITANVAGRETSYNYAYYTFLYREHDTEILLDRTWAAKSRLVIDDRPVDADRFEIQYIFCDPGKSPLAGMAEACRGILFPGMQKLNSQPVPVYLDVAMGVRVKQNFLGIPYWTLRCLTTTKQAQEIAQEFMNTPGSLVEMRLRGLDDDGLVYGRHEQKLQVSSKIGGMDGLKALQSVDGLLVYPEVDPLYFNRASFRAVPMIHSALNLLTDRIRQPVYLVASGAVNESIKPAYLLKSGRILDSVRRIADSLDKHEIRNVSASSIGYAPYGDHTRAMKNGLFRTAGLLEEAARIFSNRGGLMLEAPVSSLLPYASSVIHVPAESSRYHLEDASVPFVQMVLSSFLKFSGPDVNYAADWQSSLLQNIANGSALSFSIFASDYEAVRGTDAQNMYSSSYVENRQVWHKLCQSNQDALKPVYGCSMTDYLWTAEGLTVSFYSNGYAVLVNHSDTPLTWDVYTVEPHSWLTVNAEEGITHEADT